MAKIDRDELLVRMWLDVEIMGDEGGIMKVDGNNAPFALPLTGWVDWNQFKAVLQALKEVSIDECFGDDGFSSEEVLGAVNGQIEDAENGVAEFR